MHKLKINHTENNVIVEFTATLCSRLMFCNSVRSAGIMPEKYNAKFVNIMHVLADLLLQLFCVHNEIWGLKFNSQQ